MAQIVSLRLCLFRLCPKENQGLRSRNAQSWGKEEASIGLTCAHITTQPRGTVPRSPASVPLCHLGQRACGEQRIRVGFGAFSAHGLRLEDPCLTPWLVNSCT